MKATTEQFRQKSRETLHDVKIQENLAGLYSGFHKARLDASSATQNWDYLQEEGRRIKAQTIDRM